MYTARPLYRTTFAAILWAVTLLLNAVPAVAQSSVITGKERHPLFTTLRHKLSLPTRRSLAQRSDILTVTVWCKDSRRVARWLEGEGHRAHILTGDLLTTRVPLPLLTRLAQRDDVTHIDTGPRSHLAMDEARRLTHADEVHAGIDLDTPYTGRGVLIGIIDAGIAYRHISFLDSLGMPRALAVWNRDGNEAGLDNAPTTEIPIEPDTLMNTDHGTHVGSICAGSRIPENNFHGIAPEADLLFISSELSTPEIMEDMKYIRDFAQQRGQPWVINGSFCDNVGPHDGTDYQSRVVDTLLTNAIGCAIVGAAGNSGNKNSHASHTFTQSTDTISLLLKPNGGEVKVDLWGEATDSLRHFYYRPFVYQDSLRDYKDSTYWAGYCFDELSPYNSRQNIYMVIPADSVTQGCQYGFDIWGDEQSTIHAWVEGNTIVCPDEHFMKGDNEYGVGGMFTCNPKVIAVGSYVSKKQFTNINGRTMNISNGVLGAPCLFTCKGPSLNGEKPDVVAPGSVIAAAFSDHYRTFNPKDNTIIEAVERDGQRYYYGVKQGTSMSTPIVTGIVALMLEANPHLPASAIHEIICQTAQHDEQTGEGWDARCGHGKVDAYRCIQAALQRADTDGIPRVTDAAPAISIRREGATVHLLFGHPVSQARLTVSDLQGRLWRHTIMSHLSRGEEQTVDIEALPRGTYLLCLQTPNGNVTRKIIR